MPRVLELQGQRFGRLIARERVGAPQFARPRWKCVCECGAIVFVETTWLTSGHSRSCGCLRRDVAAASMRTHGHTQDRQQSATYRSWYAMWQRCTNPRSEKYPIYGGRGITVCDRWKSFECFLADMGERPDGKTLDRYPNNDGNYEPGNCRWATPTEQTANRRPIPKATHCINGHEFTPENTAVKRGGPRKGARSCRECNRLRVRAQRRELRMEARP